VHEWNARWLIAALGRWRRRHPRARLLFHDTHHRAITRPEELTAFDLGQYDGVLAFGACLRDIYLHHGWAARAWVWHEAADVRRFRPLMAPKSCDLVWIGNWGDEERTAELAEYLLGPAAALSIATHVYGVRYPDAARRRLASAGAEYQGWLPNARVPDIFAAASVTMHVPRRPYAERLHGIPTIRVFEALACGIPLITAPWIDSERLFTESADYLMARSGREMTRLLRDVLEDPGAAQRMAAHGLATIRSRHTCAHRVFELREIAAELGLAGAANIPAGQVPA
jgi:spore maturation protein CgeB